MCLSLRRVIALAVSASVAATACSPPPAARPRRPVESRLPSPPATPRCLSIAAWNDMHGQIGPDEVQVDATRVPAGGVIAIADQVASLRATGDAVVVLDAGDLFTGPIESTLAEGAPIIDAYNVIGVDAVAIGNHEFDFGPVGYTRVTADPALGDDAGADGPRGALLARMSAARFPFLSANLRRSDGKPLGWPRARASIRILRDGFDVGVVGYSTVETPISTLKPNVADLDFATDAAVSVATEVRRLRAAGASPVVLLAHASLDREYPQRLDDPEDPDGMRRIGEVARLMDALAPADRPDVIVAGHRHQWMLGRARGVPIVSSDMHGVGLSRIRYCRSPGEAPRLERIERHVAMASSPPSSELGRAVAEAVAPWQKQVSAAADAVVATLPQLCSYKSPNGTALAEQTARAISEHARAALPPPAGVSLVSIVNGGGVRAPLRAGPVRFRDIFATSPFENSVSACAITRAGLSRVVSNALRAPDSATILPFAIAGAKVTLVRAKNGKLTVKRVVLDGAGAASAPPPRDDDPIWLAMPSFVLWGGDAFLEGVTCATMAASPLNVRDVWRTVLEREQKCDGGPRNVVIEEP